MKTTDETCAGELMAHAFLAVAPGAPTRMLDDAVAFRGWQLDLKDLDDLAPAKALIRDAG